MDYLIYYSIANKATGAGMLHTIQGISEKLYHCHCIIKIENSRIFQRTANDMCECLYDYFSGRMLEKDDEVYLYYWATGIMGLWRIKKKGRMKMELKHNNMHCLEISFGAKLGIVD